MLVCPHCGEPCNDKSFVGEFRKCNWCGIAIPKEAPDSPEQAVHEAATRLIVSDIDVNSGWISENVNTTKTISIIIPAWNENVGIRRTIHAIPKRYLENHGFEVQILVIDAGSDDGTAEAAQNAGAEVIVELAKGYGRAYKTGFANARGDIIVTSDADGTYPLEDVPALVRSLEEEKLDFITTNRLSEMEKDAMSFRNKIGNRILSLETRILFNIDIKDPESGMWVFRKNLLPRLRLTSDGFAFSHEIKIEACHFARCRWKELLIGYKSRSAEPGKITGGWNGWKVGIVDFIHIIWKRMTKPLCQNSDVNLIEYTPSAEASQ